MLLARLLPVGLAHVANAVSWRLLWYTALKL